MNLLQKARFAAARFLMGNGEQAIRNAFNRAFLIGDGYTQYDTNGKSYIENGYNVNSIVYSIINQQSSKSASIPFSIKKIDDKNAMMKLKGMRLATKGDFTPQQTVKRMILESKAFSDEVVPLPLIAPNITQTWTEFIALYKTFLKLTGNVYIFILSPKEGANAGKPLQVYILPSHLIQIVVKKDADLLGMESPIKSYILVEGGQYIEFMAEDVIHIKYSNPNYSESGEHLYGQSPLRAAIRNILSSNTAIDLNVRTLKSGGAFGLVHGMKQAFTPDQAKELKDRLLEMNNSTENLAKIAGVSAEVGFTRLSLTSAELQPFSYLEYDENQIAKVLSWSIDDGKRSDFGGTINELRKQRITDNIQPDLELLAEAINTEFLTRFKGYEKTVIEFDYTELPEMQTDIKDLVAWLKDALDRAVINRDEFRIAISYPAIRNEAMEAFTVNQETLTLEESLDNTGLQI